MYCILNKGTQKDNDQIVPWWSFGKVVLACAIMKLVEQGKLDLNRCYFENAGTLEQLLRHEAGYPDYNNSKVYHQAVNSKTPPWDFETLIAKTDTKKLIYEPGKGWMYSNIGYYYVRQLIEKTEGCSLQEALNRLIFEPLEISNVEVAVHEEQLDQCVHVKNGYHPKWVYHGLLIGTLENACKILHNLANEKIISRPLLNKMRESYMIPFDIGDRPWKKPGYALGLMTDESNGSFGHTGMGPDSVKAVYYFPEKGCTVAVSAETSDQGQVEYEVQRLAYNLK